MTRGVAVDIYRHRQTGNVARMVIDMHRQRGGIAAQTLRSDTGSIDLFKNFFFQFGKIGGIVFAVLGCMLYGFIVSKVAGLNARYLVLALLGFVLSIISQIGDLWASLIKREHGIKDYSRMLPGHGGVMDRFDSILAISTVLMAVCMVFPPFC